MEMKRGQRLNIMELIMETQSESLLTAPLSSAVSTAPDQRTNDSVCC